MFSINDFALFIFSGLLLNITPGVDMLYVIGRSSTQGVSAGMAAALGITTGCIVHIVFAAAGLSAILATSAIAFMGLKYAGAAYLIYLGITLLLKRQDQPDSVKPYSSRDGLLKIYRQGVLINTFNPKIALFFLAFLPQFIDVSSSNKTFTFVVLGIIFSINGAFCNLFVAWFSASISQKIIGNHKLNTGLKKVMGSLFIGLGIRLALSERN